MTVSICVGSSCHLKGSYRIIELMKEEIERRGLSEQVELKGAFCFGQCGHQGVTIQVDDKIVPGVSEENFPKIFEEYIAQKA